MTLLPLPRNDGAFQTLIRFADLVSFALRCIYDLTAPESVSNFPCFFRSFGLRNLPAARRNALVTYIHKLILLQVVYYLLYEWNYFRTFCCAGRATQTCFCSKSLFRDRNRPVFPKVDNVRLDCILLQLFVSGSFGTDGDSIVPRKSIRRKG